MHPTLRYGSRGSDVVDLQNGLNRLPSRLARLQSDGVYGAKTLGRVRELQSSHRLVPDGITGPKTWKLLSDLLAAVQGGGMPATPKPTASSPGASAGDPQRTQVLMIAQQHLGSVDFQQMQGGRPKGLDFLIEMFRVATGRALTDENFIDPKTHAWTQQPWIGNPTEVRKSWCGIFCVYCYRKAGLAVSWDLAAGKPVGPIRLNHFSSHFVADIKRADIGCVATHSHHFLIESVDGGGYTPSLTTIDGNQAWGRILRRSTHRVGTDNFNYYSLT